MARIWRDGQKKTVWIYRFLSTGTIEEKIFQRQISKQGLSHSIVDGKSSQKKSAFSKEELKDLFTFNQDTLSETHDLLGCTDCLDEESLEVVQSIPKVNHGKVSKEIFDKQVSFYVF